ncbi:MAG: glycoside hydrolase family 38 C-terminal domain-containing protein [Acidimicrobiia bacterium]
MTTEVSVVPHTHWDREWYLPFQTFRLRLVDLVDALIPVLESDDGYAHFLLDGQTAVLDDYLELRPDAAPRLAALGASGRIAVGPWMILMDEYMVSGETIVRNLQLGMRRAEAFGGAMPVGYLPDMFGHIAQMPQILASAGFDHSVVWRGVPNAVDKHAFTWFAPDGSKVRAEYLWGQGYSNGRDLPRDPGELVDRIDALVRELGGARVPGSDLLVMNGTDHQLPQPWIGAAVAAANAQQSNYHLTVRSLAEHVQAQPTQGLPEWHGEMRSGARANVLMGVASNHVDVHQAAARAERLLERNAEPMAALYLPASRYPGAQLDLAWKLLVLNSAHDSSCACSVDEVVDEVLVRYRAAAQIATGIAERANTVLAKSVSAPRGSIIVTNPTATTRGGVIETLVPGGEPMCLVDERDHRYPTQVVSALGGEAYALVARGDEMWTVIGQLTHDAYNGAAVTRSTIEPQAHDTLRVTLDLGAPTDPRAELTELREQLIALAERNGTLDLHVNKVSAALVAAQVDGIPGFGWRTFRVVPGTVPGTAVATAGALANEFLRVAVDSTDGTITISTNDGVTIRGADRLVDGGDGGDTYNYSPPTADVIVDRPVAVRVLPLEAGPVRASLVVERDYRWPDAAIGDERKCSARTATDVPVTMRSTYELRAGERFLRVHVEFENPARDHRLRAHFPLPRPVRGSDAECAFMVVHRGLQAEGGPSEPALPTFVSRRFVDCSDGAQGLLVLHDGLLEYEVVNDGTELALTLLRATGYLSRTEPDLRPNAAGPPLEAPSAQLVGPVTADYALLPHAGTWIDTDAYAAADAFLMPVTGERSRSGGTAAGHGSALTVTGAPVSAVLRDEQGRLVVRVFNPTPAECEVTITHDGEPLAGDVVNLRGDVVESFTGTARLRPAQIFTVRTR